MQRFKQRKIEEDAEVAAREAAGKPTISKMEEDEKDVPPGKAYWDAPQTAEEARKRPNPYGKPVEGPYWEKRWTPWVDDRPEEAERKKRYREWELKHSPKYPGTTLPESKEDDIDQDMKINNGAEDDHWRPLWVERWTPEK